MSHHLIKKTRQRLAREHYPPLKSPEGRLHVAIAFPNTYFVGMSCLGIHAVYYNFNAHPCAVCERAFLPDEGDEGEFERSNTPLFSLESQKPLHAFHLLGFSLTFEEDYLNVLRILRLSHIPLRVSDRGESDPIVIAGGPCASYNPAPMTEFIDVFAIGDGESLIPDIVNTLYPLYFPRGGKARASRQVLLEALSSIPGLFVPSIMGSDSPVQRRSVEDLQSHPADTQIFTPQTEFANTYLIEIARGCPRRCRFCAVPYTTRPLKVVPPERVLAAVRANRHITNRIGLVGASVSDYPNIAALVRTLADEGCRVQLPSLRSDRLSEAFLDAIWTAGQRSLTLAPEAATDRLRSAVSKNIPNAQVIDSIARAARRGFRYFKLYFMIGLPGERDEDIEAFAPLIHAILNEAKGIERLALTINPFVPKPCTPLQWAAMEDITTLDKKLKLIRASLRGEKRVEMRAASTRWSQVQALLSLGDASLGKVMERAFELGGSLRAWRQAANECGLDWERVVHAVRPPDFVFPWQHINTGARRERLRTEYERCHPSAAG